MKRLLYILLFLPLLMQGQVELKLNNNQVSIKNSTLTVDTTVTEFSYIKTKAHGFYAFEDSAVVIDCTQNVWVQVTNGTNDLFTEIQTNEGFSISGDTIIFNEYNLTGSHPHIIFHWGVDGFGGNNEDYEVRIKNVSNDAGVVRKAEGSTTGANNRIEIGTTSYDRHAAFLDKWIIEIMNKTNSNDFTIENGSIYIEVSHY